MNSTEWLTLMLFLEYEEETETSDEVVEIYGLPELED